MKALLIKEIKSFFGSPIGYLVIGIYLLITGLFCWVFNGDYNLLNSGFADMAPFFKLTAWVFIFLIPAVTMRSFSDEKKQGTLEILFTKPISMWGIVLGKFLGSFFLIVIAVLPTLFYIVVINYFTAQQSDFDFGSIIGSYFGLLFLISGYTSIGVFASTLTQNQIVAFIISVIISFLFFYGFSGFSEFFGSFKNVIASFGMDYHFNSISRGVLDTRDLIYFISISIFFLSATVYQLKNLKL